MDETRLQLAAIWIALMLIYLLGDVFRIFSGDFKQGDMATAQEAQLMWMGISAMMVMPIVMILVTMMGDYTINRWLNIIVAGFFFIFNFVSIPTYSGRYDQFLLIISLGFNVLTILYAWNWIL